LRNYENRRGTGRGRRFKSTQRKGIGKFVLLFARSEWGMAGKVALEEVLRRDQLLIVQDFASALIDILGEPGLRCFGSRLCSGNLIQDFVAGGLHGFKCEKRLANRLANTPERLLGLFLDMSSNLLRDGTGKEKRKWAIVQGRNCRERSGSQL